jgi:hypothetical protein
VAKITRSDLLRELVEDAEGYEGKDEWRENKRNRRVKPIREPKSSKIKDKRRAWKVQRSIKMGEFFDSSKTTDSNERYVDDED